MRDIRDCTRDIRTKAIIAEQVKRNVQSMTFHIVSGEVHMSFENMCFSSIKPLAEQGTKKSDQILWNSLEYNARIYEE